MVTEHPLQLPSYKTFEESIAILDLPISGGELHGILSGYLAAGAAKAGQIYIRALMGNQQDDRSRTAAMALFNLYTITEQQMTHAGFCFELLLPDEDEPLADRARAFSEWCEGFSQGITMAGIDYNQIEDEETQEALQHITEFAELDYDFIQVSPDDEKSLMEVCEYTRVAVMHIFNDIQTNQLIENEENDIAH